MPFVGDDLTTQRVIDACNYIGNQSNDIDTDSRWKGLGNIDKNLTIYSMRKGLNSFGID